MIKVGIIGCGRIAKRRHIPEYSSYYGSEIVGYYDTYRPLAEEAAAQYGGVVFDTVEELLADETIQAVSICAANNVHAAMTIQALKAGKHVLCEKPMATTVEEAEAMVAASKKTGNFLMIAQNQRFNLGHVRAKELIEMGLIGKPLTFRTTFGHGGPERWCMNEITGEIPKDVWFFDKKVASMGAMADLGIHKTDLIQYLLNDRIVEVTAKMFTIDKTTSDGKPIELEDNAICMYKMASGVMGTMTVSWTYYGNEDNSTVIFGTKGTLRLYEGKDHTIQLSTDRGDQIYFDLDKMMTNEEQIQSGVIREFIQEIESGNWTNQAGESEINAMKAVLASFESSRLDKTIHL